MPINPFMGFGQQMIMLPNGMQVPVGNGLRDQAEQAIAQMMQLAPMHQAQAPIAPMTPTVTPPAPTGAMPMPNLTQGGLADLDRQAAGANIPMEDPDEATASGSPAQPPNPITGADASREMLEQFRQAPRGAGDAIEQVGAAIEKTKQGAHGDIAARITRNIPTTVDDALNRFNLPQGGITGIRPEDLAGDFGPGADPVPGRADALGVPGLIPGSGGVPRTPAPTAASTSGAAPVPPRPGAGLSGAPPSAVQKATASTSAPAPATATATGSSLAQSPAATGVPQGTLMEAIEKMLGPAGSRTGQPLFNGGMLGGLLNDPNRAALLEMGLNTMAAASQPNANFGGSLATGGLAALRGARGRTAAQYKRDQDARKERLDRAKVLLGGIVEDRRAARQDRRDKDTANFRRKDLDIKERNLKRLERGKPDRELIAATAKDLMKQTDDLGQPKYTAQEARRLATELVTGKGGADEAMPVPTLGDGRPDHSKLRIGKAYQNKNGQVAIYRGPGQWEPVR